MWKQKASWWHRHPVNTVSVRLPGRQWTFGLGETKCLDTVQCNYFRFTADGEVGVVRIAEY